MNSEDSVVILIALRRKMMMVALAAVALVLASATVSHAQDDDGYKDCVRVCEKQKRDCRGGRLLTDCPGTGLFGDPQKAEHDRCVKEIDRERKECDLDYKDCELNC